MRRAKRTMINPGDKFGKLTVLSFSNLQGFHRQWNVVCECGTRKVITGNHMIQGHSTSCGCARRKATSKKDGHAGFRRVFSQYKANARNRSYEFNLTFENFIAIASQACYYCNGGPKLFNTYLNEDGSRREKRVTQSTIDRAWININGVDRKNGESYYEVENCVPCCTICNWMKGDMTEQEFAQHVNKITANLEERI